MKAYLSEFLTEGLTGEHYRDAFKIFNQSYLGQYTYEEAIDEFINSLDKTLFGGESISGSDLTYHGLTTTILQKLFSEQHGLILSNAYYDLVLEKREEVWYVTKITERIPFTMLMPGLRIPRPNILQINILKPGRKYPSTEFDPVS